MKLSAPFGFGIEIFWLMQTDTKHTKPSSKTNVSSKEFMLYFGPIS